MKTQITLNQITETSTGVPMAECTIDMCSKEYRSNSIVKVKVSITHHAIRVTSSHTMSDLRFITDNMEEGRIRNYGVEKMAAQKILDTVLTF